MPGDKYVATDLEATWQAEGSTTVTPIALFGRNTEVNEEMDSADATGYGNGNRIYRPTIKDASITMEIMLDDDYEIEDLLFAGARGTIRIYPLGNLMGEKEIELLAFISARPRQYPFDDVAIMNVTFMPLDELTESLVA